MPKPLQDRIQTLDIDLPVWERFFTVAPLVLIGTKEQAGGYDLAPKHMALPLGWGNYFGFVCTPRHRTYQNIQRERIFTVSFPRPTQVLLASLAAVPRCDEEEEKSSLHVLPTFPARQVDGIFIEDAYVFLECELDRIIDGFGDNSLVAGRIVAAHVHEDVLRTSDRDEQELIYTAPLFAYLYPGRTARISESFSFPFPVNFKR